MSRDLRDLIDGEAELDDEEDDESFDEEGGDSRPKKARPDLDDSSEEDEDDDEEEARKVGEYHGCGSCKDNVSNRTSPRSAKDLL